MELIKLAKFTRNWSKTSKAAQLKLSRNNKVLSTVIAQRIVYASRNLQWGVQLVRNGDYNYFIEVKKLYLFLILHKNVPKAKTLIKNILIYCSFEFEQQPQWLRWIKWIKNGLRGFRKDQFHIKRWGFLQFAHKKPSSWLQP